jgi:hypothetical protein
MDSLKTTPEPGWYADPESDAQLRLWDGVQWTTQTRASVDAPTLPADGTEPIKSRAAGHRIRPSSSHLGARPMLAAIAVVAILGFVIAKMLAGTTSTHGAAPVAPHNTPAPAKPCGAAPTTALLAVRWFVFQYPGGGFWPLADTTAAHPGTCSAETFRDPRSPGTNLVLVYTTSAAAAQATTSMVGGSAPKVAEGRLVVVLDPLLTAHQDEYRTWLRGFAAKVSPGSTSS